jgi:hypothetical protein
VRSLFLCVQLLHKVHQLCASLRDAKLVRSLCLCVQLFHQEPRLCASLREIAIVCRL